MTLELLTKQDLYSLKHEILTEVRSLVKSAAPEKEWLKSSEVQNLLSCSPGTLQNYRIQGHLPYSKVGGTIYYKLEDVIRLLNKQR